MDVDTLETEDAAQRIRDRSIRVELAAALDHWAHLRLRRMPRTADERMWKHLIRVAQAADPDSWRNQLRSVLQRSPMDQKILQGLAASAELVSSLTYSAMNSARLLCWGFVHIPAKRYSKHKTPLPRDGLACRTT